MKGIIFLKLAEFVESTFGEDAWDDLLIRSQPKSQGAYTSAILYDDEEFFSLVTHLCEQQELDMPTAQRAFGNWVFAHLVAIAPHDMRGYTDTFGFLRAIQDVIHVEVKKVHTDAILPEFEFLSQTDSKLLMRYESPRKLCYFCEGLIDALTMHLNENVRLRQTECEHEGHARCVFELEKL